jgi:hypothetical protein
MSRGRLEPVENRRMAFRDAARSALEAGELSQPDYVTFCRLLDESNVSADPVDRKRSTIGRKICRCVRTVTARTTSLEAGGWLEKTQRKVRLSSGQFRSLSSRYRLLIPDRWHRVVTRPDPVRTTSPPPRPVVSARETGPLVAVPPVRSGPAPLTPLAERVLAIARKAARAP